jgi:hypothetical protein
MHGISIEPTTGSIIQIFRQSDRREERDAAAPHGGEPFIGALWVTLLVAKPSLSVTTRNLATSLLDIDATNFRAFDVDLLAAEAIFGRPECIPLGSIARVCSNRAAAQRLSWCPFLYRCTLADVVSARPKFFSRRSPCGFSHSSPSCSPLSLPQHLLPRQLL